MKNSFNFFYINLINGFKLIFEGLKLIFWLMFSIICDTTKLVSVLIGMIIFIISFTFMALFTGIVLAIKCIIIVAFYIFCSSVYYIKKYFKR